MESKITTVIQTDNAPKAVGPYTQGRTVEGHARLVFTAGQVAMDPKTGNLVSEEVAEQADLAIRNLEAVLQAGGSSLDNVLKTTVFLVSMDDFARANEVYKKYFKEPFPARSCVAVKELPKGAKYEIEAVAFASEGSIKAKL